MTDLSALWHDLLGSAWTVWRYDEDFDRMWASLEARGPSARREDLHLVVWTRTPADPTVEPVNTEEFVSPLEWAFAARVQNAAARVLIVNLNARRNVASVLQRLYGLVDPSQLGWLRVLNPAQFLTLGADLPALRRALTPSAGRSVQGAPDLCMDLFSRYLRLRLTDVTGETDRHAITNLVGPMLLLGDHQAMATRHRRALRVLLTAVGLWSNSGGEESRKPAGSGDDRNHVNKVVLVDDMADHGWAEYLRRALGLHHTELLVCRDPFNDKSLGAHRDASLVDHLERHIRGMAEGCAPDALALSGEPAEVLFLDLRLCSSLDRPRERALYRKLVELARLLTHAEAPALRWPRLDDHELWQIERWCDEGLAHRDAQYYSALTLLPRLIALADPTLPIVLFSSTTHKDVVRHLQRYRTVITSFAKPSFMTASADTRMQLVRTMDAAERLAKGRAACRSMRLTPVVMSAPTPEVEIYVDESGVASSRYGFAVGGVMVQYPNSGAIDTLDDELKASDLVWGLADGLAPRDDTEPLPQRYLPKFPPEYESPLQSIVAAMQRTGATIRGFAVVAARRAMPPPDSTQLLREDGLDNLYRALLSECLEAALCAVVPNESAMHVSIDVATRLAKARDDDEKRRLMRDYGVWFLGPGLHYYALGSEDVYPVVAGIMARHGAAVNKLTFGRVRGTTLYDFAYLRELQTSTDPKDRGHYAKIVNATRETRPRVVHYLADWVARLALMETSGSMLVPPVAHAWLKNGFVHRHDASLQHWLRALHAASHPHGPTSVIEAVRAANAEEDKLGAEFSIGRWVRPRVAKSIARLTGVDFIELCDGLLGHRVGAIRRVDPVVRTSNSEEKL